MHNCDAVQSSDLPARSYDDDMTIRRVRMGWYLFESNARIGAPDIECRSNHHASIII